MDAIDLAASVIKAYDRRVRDLWQDGLSGIRIEEMARAMAMLTTYTEREALDSLKVELHKFANSSGALNKMFDAKTLGKVKILAGDLERLRIARDIIADVSPDLWTDSPAYVRKLNGIDARGALDKLIAEGNWCLNKEEDRKCK